MYDGGCTSPAGATPPCPGDVDLYLRSIAALLPPGWAWEAVDYPDSIMGARAKVLAHVFHAFHQKACELLPEFHCFSVKDTLDSWYADYGLPDNCGLNDLCAKVVALGGQDCASYIELGQLLGFDLCCQEIPVEVQVGCWALGVQQLAPEPDYRYGGSELGFAGLGDCISEIEGVALGQGVLGPEDCNIVGYHETDPAGIVPGSICRNEPTCEDFQFSATETLICGKSRRWGIDHYVGTAHHWIVGLTTDNPVLGSFGTCEPPPSIDQFDIGDDGLGTYVPGVPVPEDYAIGGCWDLGVSELCQPPVDAVMCFIQRFKPAHTVAIRRYCAQGSILQ